MADDGVHNECVELQQSELELLTSMYEPGELVFSTSQSNYGSSEFQLGSNFIVKITLPPAILVDVSIQFPTLYPLKEHPVVFVRSTGELNDNELNHALRQWLSEEEHGYPLTTNVVGWIQDNAQNFKTKGTNANGLLHNSMFSPSKSKPTVEGYARYWIHSHHLFSTVKRTDICKLAKEGGLSGFSTPGSPAIIVVEGVESRCKQFWMEIKSWIWQRIIVRHTETSPVEAGFCKFKGFREIILPSSDSKHVQTGPIKAMLTELGLEENFKIVYNI